LGRVSVDGIQAGRGRGARESGGETKPQIVRQPRPRTLLLLPPRLAVSGEQTEEARGEPGEEIEGLALCARGYIYFDPTARMSWSGGEPERGGDQRRRCGGHSELRCLLRRFTPLTPVDGGPSVVAGHWKPGMEHIAGLFSPRNLLTRDVLSL
jgi:hypothetical protein